MVDIFGMILEIISRPFNIELLNYVMAFCCVPLVTAIYGFVLQILLKIVGSLQKMSRSWFPVQLLL